MLPTLKLAIVSCHPPGKGTLNEYGYYLLRHFRENPLFSEITLIADELPTGQSYPPGLNVEQVRTVTAWKFNSWRNCWRILKAVRKAKPDIVLFNMQFLLFGDRKVPAALGLLTPLLLKLSGYPSVVVLHNILEQVDLQNAGITKNRMLAKIYNITGTMLSRFVLMADLVTVTISKYVQILEAKYRKGNVALIPHGSFENSPLPAQDLPPGPMKIMTFGKFGTYKKVEVLIEAVQRFRQRSTLDVEIVIAGTDSPNSKGYLNTVKEKYAHVPGLIFTGYVAEEDVPRIFSESAVVVFPYTSTTGSSGVLHQAGNYGKAVILPDIGDLGALIREEGYSGELFQPEDPESLANAIQQVLHNDAYRIQMGIRNYHAAVSLPMQDLTNWYYMHFLGILKN
ncbi:MAG: glycosyltransferase [Pseudobacter sp.]|uniref:glycosyltransferase n=1 Tax=Pseudobacter sp. TaxID=2045420 RepID=UPI003F8159C8